MTGATRTSAWLVDERWAKAYPLGEVATIGRGAQATIILRDAAVSRVHAEVRWDSGAADYMLSPQGASGTKVNGVAVAADRALREGDIVEIAFTLLRFTTRPPTSEMQVIARDTPTLLDAYEGPTRTSPAIDPAAILKASRVRWARLWRWLTRRPNTD